MSSGLTPKEYARLQILSAIESKLKTFRDSEDESEMFYRSAEKYYAEIHDALVDEWNFTDPDMSSKVAEMHKRERRGTPYTQLYEYSSLV